MTDEFQEFVTIGHGLEGGDKFFGKSRQSKHISIMATQSYASLLNALGSKSEKVAVSPRVSVFGFS